MLTIKFSEVPKGDVALVGGKGASLGEMTQAHIPVPDGFIVTTEAFQLADGKISDDLADELYRRLDELGAELVAVRSSAVAEDSPTSSWAGQFESYLNVKREDLLARIVGCWESLSSGHAYANTTQTGDEGLVMAVVVQKMVNSEVSGVAFSVNPITKAPDEIMIEAVYGLGELLVQGMLTPDNYVIRKPSLEVIGKTISNKTIMLSYEAGKNTEVPVPDDKAQEPCLTEDKIQSLAHIIVDIEEHYGIPQDIEWALEGGKFYIVQSRPITTL
jgi:phosphoenolpyruvate synthase/pyruvate phosphate dikinase